MKWTPGIIEQKSVWAEGLFTLRIRAPEVQSFEPGQFLQLGMEQPDGHLHRPYSVASPHGELLDFFIVVVPDGRLTPQLWKLEPGNSVDVSKRAAGSFTLSHCPDAKDLWLISTGTGLAPYIAMLRTELPWQRYDRITVVHGVRYAADLAYQPELAQFTATYGDRFHHIPVVSREAAPQALPGRITTCIVNGSLEERAATRFTKDSCIMMCGNPDMLQEMENILGERGLRKHKQKEPGQIVVERYW
ncbi:ferredoxin--NADP reductase [Aureliella helgolandensis]|uniref:ferredoxin--NADP(+) reductase n=1 Tax=Aureliella helgolandensis TaxID=2527968 RepID=A0A518G697_9BACT|nr:ferredoxin--NADP reductase [Aureliella helgolandensis]QDV24116.1 Ferredoxin--NADP reductase [Aureliella helgolandensis]